MLKKILITLIFCVPAYSQWVQSTSTPQGSGITGMALNVYGDLVVSTGSINGGQQGGIRISVDGGQNWNNYFDCFIARTLTSSKQQLLYASIWNYPTSNEGIYISFGGNAWNPLYNFPSTGNNIFSIATANDTLIYAGTRTGILRSTNLGVSFAFSNSGIPSDSWVWSLAIDSAGIVAAATSKGLFISSDHGNSWQQTTGLPAGDTVTAVIFYKTVERGENIEELVAGTDDGKILKSSSKSGYTGLIISYLLGTNVKVESINKVAVPIEDLYVAASPKNSQQPGGGIYKSNDYGQTFSIINTGLPSNPVASKIISQLNNDSTSKTLFTGLFNNTNNGAQVYSQTKLIGIQQVSNEVPKGFTLLQNYPNPFNPVTNIEFAVSKSSAVKLIIFDVLGREVEKLVDKNLNAGTYKTDWNASGYAGGVYFYKLITADFTETRKMILVK